MKMKKTLAVVASFAMAASMVSAFSMSASALTEGTVIDFEDGDCSFVYMNVDSGADASILSVEDYDGSKQLKVDVQKTGMVPKVWFDLDKITDRANTVQINSIELDLTFVPKNETDAVGWAGGAIGAAGGFEQSNPAASQKDPAWSDGQWSCEDNNAYEPGMAAKVHVTRKFLLPSTKYTETGANPFFGIMRWASDIDYVMYVDNVVLKDKNGNALPIGSFAAAEEAEGEADLEEGAAEEATEAPVEEATEAPAEEATEAPAVEEVAEEPVAAVTEEVVTEAVAVTEEVVTEAAPAPVAVEATPVAPTGNTTVAVIAGVMALAGAAAVATKRK
ncbi:MAG: hypothetical protein NC120_00590 [Ruminococcus sp.]|nr:hypothetical protein [Ruminococcus sp.]